MGNTIGILAISLMMYASGSLIAPALNALQEAFPDTPYGTIRMIMSSMYLTVLIFSLISGKLGDLVSKDVYKRQAQAPVKVPFDIFNPGAVQNRA